MLIRYLGDPTVPKLVALAREIQNRIDSEKTNSEELGVESPNEEDEDEEDEEHYLEAGVPPLGTNNFRTIDEMAEETANLCDQYAASPRAVSRTTPLPRKSKNHNQYMQEFSKSFGLLTGVITSSLTGGNQEGAAGEPAIDHTERLMKLEEHVGSISGDVQSLSADVHNVSSEVHELSVEVIIYSC